MSYWDDMDKKVWESSVVMKELEKIYKKSQSDLGKQISDLAKSVAGAAGPIKQTADAAKELKAVVAPSAKAEDGEVKNTPKKKKKISKTQHKKAKESLLKELHHLANEASDKLDQKLAYKIERAIDAIEWDE